MERVPTLIRVTSRRRRQSDADDNGFTLIETLIAVAILALLFPMFLSAATSGTQAGNQGRVRQVASVLADTAVDYARAIDPTQLLNGRSAGSATSTPRGVSLANTDQYDQTAGTPAVPLSSSSVIDNYHFSTQTFMGVCYLQLGQTSSACNTTSSGAPMVRVVVAVSWPATGVCPANTCDYVTSSLISTGTDPQFAEVIPSGSSSSSTTTTAPPPPCPNGATSFADTAASTDPMCVYNATSSSNGGPFTDSSPTSSDLSFPGDSGAYGAELNSSPGPSSSSFTIAVWFKTSQSGVLMGFANTSSGSGGNDWDKVLWVDNNGHVVFGAYNGNTIELKSPGTYNGGDWHLAVASISSTAGMTLYVDGSKVASNSVTSSQAYTGYWNIGWDNVSGWPDNPDQNSLQGSLSDAAVFPSALSSSQVSALASVGSQTTWSSTVTADGASKAWPL